MPLSADKHQLIKDECEWYLPPETNPFGSTITITGHKLAAAAGIDESNVQDSYVLLPSHIDRTAHSIQRWFMRTYAVDSIGVLIVDSRSTPLNLGTTGQVIAYARIQPINDYRGKNDLFGRTITISRLNVLNCLASAATLAMGEGSERTPIVVIEDTTQITFSQNYSGDTLDYDKRQDLYAKLLATDAWQVGGRGYLKRQT